MITQTQNPAGTAAPATTWTWPHQNAFVAQGWQCPICHRVYSPTTPMCLYCPANEAQITFRSLATTETTQAAEPEKEEGK